MTESLIGAQKKIARDKAGGSETQSTFDRLLRDYFGSSAECTVSSISGSHTRERSTRTWNFSRQLSAELAEH
jgi:hypothetical protein